MGNRAYVVFENEKSTEFSPAIYLHWNGGAESVYAFVKALEDYHCRKTDLAYCASRFCQIVCNFMGGTLSVGLENVCSAKDMEKLMPGDNGLFVFAWIPKAGGPSDSEIRTEGNNNGQWRVRRMVSDYSSGEEKPMWLTNSEVEIERKEAMESSYWTGEHPIFKVIRERNNSHFEEEAIA